MFSEDYESSSRTSPLKNNYLSSTITTSSQVLISDSYLESEATCITDRYDSFSSALDCLLGIGAQSDYLGSVSQDAVYLEDVRDDSCECTVEDSCDGRVKSVGIPDPGSAPPPRPPPRKSRGLMWDCRKGD